MSNSITTILIGAPSSGCGKTTITMGLIAALQRRGLTVQPFKIGPDYIDSAYHGALAGRTCINLDSWMTSDSFMKASFAKHCKGADVAIIEGVMGLFDGKDERSSSAGIAKLLDVPVLVVVDAGKSAQSAAAVTYGLENFDPDLNVNAVIFNQIASPGHLDMVISSVAKRCKTQPLGYLPKNKELALPERQLGLLSVHEHGLPEKYINLLVENIEQHIKIEELLSVATTAVPSCALKQDRIEPAAQTARLGIAKDEAFCFYYQDNLDLLEQAGIELIPFSPMNDGKLPKNLDGLYFGGGFPEEFSGKLSENQGMLDSVRQFKGKILAECGGLIYLTNHVDLIDGNIEMTDKLQACGYREVTFTRDTILGPKGTKLRGHEFHWSKWTAQPKSGYGVFLTGEHAWGYADERILASYFHIHFGSNTEAMLSFRDRLNERQYD